MTYLTETERACFQAVDDQVPGSDLVGIAERVAERVANIRVGTTDGERCRRCSGENVIWFAPSPLWNFVMRGNDIDGDPLYHDLVCMACFVVLAETAGVEGPWMLTTRTPPDGLIFTTPTGRVWNGRDQRWDDPAGATA